MSTWSQMVVELHKEGYTPEEIQERIALPLVTQEYVNTVLTNNKLFTRRYRPAKRYIQESEPAEGTLKRIAYDKVQAMGGNDAFLEVLKTKSQYTLAKEWGVSRDVVKNYKEKFITGCLRVGAWQGDFYSLPQMLEQQEFIATRGKSRRNKKKNLTIKDVRNLW